MKPAWGESTAFRVGHAPLIVRRQSKKKGRLEILGVLESKVKLRERFDMFGSVSATATARFPVHFEAAISALQK